MFTRRMLPVSILLTLVLTLMVTASVSAQEVDDLGGSAVFRDADAASDSLVMSFSGVPALPEGSAYEGWLLDSAGGKVSVGILIRSGTADIEETYVSPSGANLLATYSRFAISIEPVPDPDPATPGPIAYSDAIPAGAFLHVGHLVVAFAPNPDAKGIAVGFLEQMGVAATHADLAARSSSLADKQKHAQHVINIIEGLGGANFDAGPGNPGDGLGVLAYGADLIKHAQLAKDAASDDESVGDGADDAIAAAQTAIVFAERTRDEAVVAIDSGTSEFRLGIAIANMVSLTEDGVRDAEAAYTASQDIGLFEAIAGEGEAPPVVGDPLVPTVAMAALLVGLLLTGAGGLLVFRRRQTA
ncbi:MAG: anti-sigma factor [Chloroflexi bacterium]|nr:anti-sigma factor [Chloroflexota bacterium]